MGSAAGVLEIIEEVQVIADLLERKAELPRMPDDGQPVERRVSQN